MAETRLSDEQKQTVAKFAEFIDGLDYAGSEAAIAALGEVICLHCGVTLDEKHPICCCTWDD